MNAEMSVSEPIAEVLDWLFSVDPLASGDVDRVARLLFLDTLGCAIAGLARPELVALEERFARFDSGVVQLPGMRSPLTPTAAAYLVGMAATWDEACEGLARAHGRPGLHAFPVAVSLTLASSGTLGDALSAMVRGFEIGARLGERLRIRPGMHVDGTWGTFGAVAAAGSCLGFDVQLTMQAIEAAGCQTPFSLYLPVSDGATVRNSYVAAACSRAIALALTVDAGVTTPHGGLELFDELALGSSGRGAAMAPPGEWLIEQGYLKPFAAVRYVHYGAEAARQWHERRRGHTEDIESLILEVYPRGHHLLREPCSVHRDPGPVQPPQTGWSATRLISAVLDGPSDAILASCLVGS